MNKDLLEKIDSGFGLTHPATFHADDVLSTCLLRLLNPKIKIIRSNVIQNDFNGVVYDIGLGEYDHHQCNAKVRENGIKYAAFGLLWKDLSDCFMDAAHADLFDNAFVSEIDRCDNGPDTNLLSSSIELFNPTWNSKESLDENFEEAVRIFTPVLQSLIYHFRKSTFVPRYCNDMDECIKKAFAGLYEEITESKIEIPHFADIRDVWESCSYLITPNESPKFFDRTFLSQVNRTYGKYKTSPFVLAISCLRKKDRTDILSKIMKRRIFNINALEPARKRCEEIYQSSSRKDLIVLDCYMPYDSMIEQHESIKAIIFPSERKGYTILCANMNLQEKQSNGINIKKVCRRMEFPNELRGQEESVLSKAYNGLFFVHPSGYMACCNTLDDAINFYKKIAKY